MKTKVIAIRSLLCCRNIFKLSFTLSYRDVEAIMKMRGVHTDHAAIQRCVYKFAPLMEMQIKKRKVPRNRIPESKPNCN